MRLANFILNILLFCIVPFGIHAQPIFNNIKSSRISGIGGLSSTGNTLDAFPGNSSALGLIEFSSISINTENRFIGSGIIGSNVLGSLKTNQYSSLGVGIEYYGLAEHHQLNLRLGYGMQLNQNISIGVSGGLANFSNITNERTNLGLMQYGIQYNVLKSFSLGFSFHHTINSNSSTNFGNYFAVLAGFRYVLSTMVDLYGEYEQNKNNTKGNLKFGIDYRPSKILAFRSGITSFPISFTSGLSLALSSRILLDTAFSFYQYLGFTPSLGIRIEFYQKTPTT